MADDAIIDQIASNIAGIESAGSGDYAALGPMTGGDRAYGKYQIMGTNVPSWTKEALGEEYDPDRFLADPDAQEKTARFKMGQYYDQYGTPEDVASMWHSGLPYQEAVAKGRKDVLGTTTEDYGRRVASSMGPEPTIIVLPDGREIDLGVDPTPELTEQVKAKIRAEFPDLGTQPAAVGDTAPIAPSQPSVTTAPITVESRQVSPELSVEKPWRGLSIEEATAEANAAMGLAPDASLGGYGTDVAKPIADAISDVYNAFFQAAPAGGDPTNLATWGDALDRSLKLLHPLGVPAEIAGNLAFRALNDAGANPNVSGALATLLSVGVGAKTPIPGMTVAPGPKMPLQGTAATRAAAAETAALAGQADEAITGVRAASEAAATRADELAAQADAAAQTASPTPEAMSRAQAALTPSGTTATEGAAAVTRQLERELKDVKDPVQGIYNALVETAEAEHRSLDPSHYKRISEQIAALKEELGATLQGQPAAVVDDIENAINSGQRLGARQLDAYKAQLDTLFEGRKPPHGATPKTKAMYDFKWEVRDMMRSMYDGEERQWAEAADALWRDVIIGKDSPQALGNLVKLARKNPQTFVERVFGNGSADKQGVYAEAVMKHLDDAAKTKMREAVLSRAMDNAADATTGNLDPAKLLSNVGKYNKQFYDAIVTKDVDEFFKTLQKEQSAVGETALAAKTATREAGAAGRAVGVAEREAAKAGKTAASAAAEAAEPNFLARMTATGLEIGGVALANYLGGPMAANWAAGAMGARRALQLFIPRASLAKALADSKGANLIVRAMKTPLKSKASLAVINELRNRGTSVGFLGNDEEEK